MGSQNQLGPLPGGNTRTLDITAATVLKANPGRVYTVSILVAGSTTGAIYDNTLTTGNSVTNQIGTIQEAIGTQPFYGFPTTSGIVVVPGTGQTLAVSWS
ncbi:hypothetical protein [Dyella caseinilytica]|uniref:DUF4183 domain-containing protein n=1 Tax=Dyella caseinilytica TaxID=1849581 RepID=A0ABX7GZK4_9GAMM|nr:hypothetical protein [Dyella caseinilytica]QRN55254.1 hypothetical protein ISN74_07965 [Dyella caseinilytica]GGA00471.1 hypothetical protein GCM10011408_21720 [Dyella caseinilytica]